MKRDTAKEHRITKKKLLILLLSLLLVVAFWAFVIHYVFYDIQHLKGQEMIGEAASPDGRYTVIAYLNNGGATTDSAVLCSLNNNQTDKTKNIYWNYHCRTADIRWLDDQTVVINGVTLDVLHDAYDWRNP